MKINGIDTSKGGTTNAFIEWLWYRGYEIVKADTPNANFQCYEATITDKSGYNKVTVFFGGCDAAHITARIDKINGTHKWYYGKTLGQIEAVVRQCMEGYTFEEHTEEPAEEAEENKEEDTMGTTLFDTIKATAHTTDQTVIEQIASRILDQYGENVTEAKATNATIEIMQEMGLRTAEVGDRVKMGGTTYTIGEIFYAQLFQSSYKPCSDDGWMIEFKDTNGGYHYWKQYLDGGEFIKATTNNKEEETMETKTNNSEFTTPDGTIYGANDAGTYYYKIVNGKKTRISYEAFGEAVDSVPFEGDITEHMIDNEEENTMETKITVTTTDTIPTTTKNEKEETTMKTAATTATLNLTDGTVHFEYNGITYKYNIETKRYAKTTPDGKTTRIGKAEYDTNWASYEQEILDRQPSKIEVNSDLAKPAEMDEFGGVDCRHCNVNGCVHRNCMRRNPRNVGGLGECPRLDVKPIVIDEGVVDTELEEIIDETGLEPADAELERNIRKEKKAKKASKPRRSKDIAYEGNGVTLTAKQVDFLNHLPDTDFWENGLDSCIWVDILCDQIGGQFADKPMTVGAMISTLCEKGLGSRGKDKINGHKATFFSLTELGQKVAGELGLA